MMFLPTTHFKVNKPTVDFPLDFQVVSRTDYVCVLANSNNETYTISPLVIEQRLRQGRISVIAFPVHPSHRMDKTLLTVGDPTLVPQCSGCMLRSNEEQIQFECALPAREILGPDSFGGTDYPTVDGTEHPWIRRGPGPLPRTTAMPIPRTTRHVQIEGEPLNTICPACVLANEGPPVIRLCVTHATDVWAECDAWLRERIKTVPPADLGVRLISELDSRRDRARNESR